MLGFTGGTTAVKTSRERASIESDHRVRGPLSAQGWLLEKASDRPFEPLIRTIEGEIIPRLLLAHKSAASVSADGVRSGLLPTSDHVVEFASLVLSHDATSACGYVDAMVDQGYRIDTLYLDLIAATARHLGVLWEQDLCDFVEVTMALGRLQHVIREFSPVFRDVERPTHAASRRVLLAPAPGEQHSLGLMMVKEFFIRSGWDAHGGPGMPHQDVCNLVAADWYDSVGISVGIDGHAEGLAAWLKAVRASSKNPDLVILVGGPRFSEYPELAAAVGADGTALDARAAVEQAEILVSGRSGR